MLSPEPLIRQPTNIRVALIIVAWFGLAVLNALVIFALGGWLGPADMFLVWSAPAGLLWLISSANVAPSPPTI